MRKGVERKLETKKKNAIATRRQRNGLRLFSRRARTGVVAAVAVTAVCFVLLPLCLDRLSRANAAFAIAPSDDAVSPTPTASAAPLLLASEAPGETPAPNNGTRISSYSLLQERDEYETVRALQLRLMELGYLDYDEPTTYYGSATAAAVSLFQRTLEYDMDGVADISLQESLFSGDAAPYAVKIGDNGADVKSIQSRLSELGYYTDKINGFYGGATEDAVRAFQTKNKLPSDGVFHVEDRELLFSPAARPKIDPTPTPSPTPSPTPRPTARPTAKPTARPTVKPTAKPTSAPTAAVPVITPVGATPTPVPDPTAVPDPTEPPTETPMPDPTAAPEPTPTPEPPPPPSVSEVEAFLAFANQQLGKKYVWSEEGPNTFDCSGFVYYCLRNSGVKVSRYSASGFSQVSSWGRISSRHDLQPGDLMFFKNDSSSRISHTGIYLGNDKFIHASSSAGKVIISSSTTSYWTRNFMLGRRVF